MSSMQEGLEIYNLLGYLVIPNALELAQVDEINAAIDSDLVQPSPFWTEREEGQVALNVHMLLSCEAMAVRMRPPTLMPPLEGILRGGICVEEHSARIRKPFDRESYCNWHRDGGGWPGMPAIPPYHTHYVPVAFHLTNVDERKHTFSVLPGSGQIEDLPSLANYDLNNAHHIEGAKVTAIIFNGGNVRKTDRERRTIHIYCGRSSAPPISNYTISPRRL